MTSLVLWKVEQGKLYVDGKYVPFDYDIGRFKPGSEIYPIEDKLLVVLSTAERNGVLLPLEKQPKRGDIDYARNAYCVDLRGNILWRGEALRLINTYAGFNIKSPSNVIAIFDHGQQCEIDMETGKLKRKPNDPPASEW